MFPCSTAESLTIAQRRYLRRGPEGDSVTVGDRRTTQELDFSSISWKSTARRRHPRSTLLLSSQLRPHTLPNTPLRSMPKSESQVTSTAIRASRRQDHQWVAS
ncbi:hypothetical protein SCLCIDRAFT_1215598 [Scleroderma citrinum Foug A]|uniref:Uncharacterized protein n=1 Tax=Scleroderma citrinum Foug A TaxID=1036808 RepID=A0A0C3E0F7_9AGAM|nr:hypothetical protein SCLCIDRAFT_1215598 [Scleroderma citrinum Foug A]